jgi:dihydroflavonol-4-reductase
MPSKSKQPNGEPARVFITGATGFLGGALVRAMAQQGAEIHAFVRPTADRSTLDGLPVIWHEGNVTLPETLKGVFARAAFIIHAAGRLGEAGIPEEIYQQIHVDGTHNVLAEAMDAMDKPRVLYVSSPGVLGPIRGEPAGEDAPLAPSNPYERSKAAAEEVARGFAVRGLPVIIARPEFVYGPGDRHVLGMFRAVLRGQFFYVDAGQHFCHPTFIDDAVQGMLACMNQGRSGEAYHITGPRPVTFREFAETIAGALSVRAPRLSLPKWLAMVGAAGLETLWMLTGRKAPLSRTGVAFFSEDRRFSWQKAQNDLGYSPRYDLTAGVSQTVQWYRQRGWL